MAALNHPKADSVTTWFAARNHDPQVAMAALNHPKADDLTTRNAAEHQDPQVRARAEQLMSKFK
jgi:hypothetical protein